TLQRAFNALTPLYIENPKIREILPFSKEEQAWLKCYLPQHNHHPNTIYARWDANTNFAGKNWKKSFHFFEINAVGIGGLHYAPMADGIIQDIVLPELRKVDPHIQLQANDDVRNLLVQEIKTHLKQLNIRQANVALLVDTQCTGGPLDFQYLIGYCKKFGITAKIVDPREVRMKGDQFYAHDFRIDLFYRDTTLEEMIDLGRVGHDIRALGEGFRQNRMISSLGGEFDHKSVFEIFTHPDFEQYFSKDAVRYMRRHILWTRLVREIKTPTPEGKMVDLISFCLKHQRKLVLKPNRSFGGVDILIGSKTTCKDWEKTIQWALKHPGSYVVQIKAPIRKKKFPLILKDHTIAEKKLNVVCGFIATPQGLGILGRASSQEIVNVAQGGGMTSIQICLNN
ncbi:MAG: hypothetical protein Q8Q33_09465, partial [Chlamydiota bacterium]|nr:hypothetical protein [Chlamydiota bacterium]